MAQEIEAKYRVEDHAELRRRLREASARPLGRVLETNSFFDTPQGTLRQQDRGLRIRAAVPIDEQNAAIPGRPARTTITYKGPRLESRWKVRQEIELVVDDAATAEALLEALGFVRALSFQKRRESWRLDDCAVELDELPYLGRFVEIEGPDASIEGVARRLGLADLPVEKAAYSTLLHELSRQRGLGAEIAFPVER